MTAPTLDADDIFAKRDPMAPAPVSRTVPVHHISAVMNDVVAALDAGRPMMVPTPYNDLNVLFGGGFRAGELVFLGSRPGVGKTALALEIARAAAKTMPVLVVSREMVNVALGRRLLAQDGRVAASDVRRSDVLPCDLPAVTASWERLSGLNLWLTDAAVSLAHIEALAEDPPDKVVAWGLIIVDYLQLVRAPAEVKDRRLQVETISQGLKGLALTHKIPVLCLTSLRRPTAGNPRPSMADLRESGELEHDADIIILLHREPDKPGEPPNTIVECNVAKNRDGETGQRDLIFNPRYVSFAARAYEGGA